MAGDYEWLSAPEAARRAGVVLRTLRQWITRGIVLSDGTHARLSARRDGGRWKVRMADIDAFREQCREGSIEADRGGFAAPCPEPQSSAARRLAACNERLKGMGVL